VRKSVRFSAVFYPYRIIDPHRKKRQWLLAAIC